MEQDVIPHPQQAWNNFFCQKSASDKERIVESTAKALAAGEQVIISNNRTRLGTGNLPDSDRLMLPVRTSLFTKQTTELETHTISMPAAASLIDNSILKDYEIIE